MRKELENKVGRDKGGGGGGVIPRERRRSRGSIARKASLKKYFHLRTNSPPFSFFFLFLLSSSLLYASLLYAQVSAIALNELSAILPRAESPVLGIRECYRGEQPSSFLATSLQT